MDSNSGGKQIQPRRHAANPYMVPAADEPRRRALNVTPAKIDSLFVGRPVEPRTQIVEVRVTNREAFADVLMGLKYTVCVAAFMGVLVAITVVVAAFVPSSGTSGNPDLYRMYHPSFTESMINGFGVFGLACLAMGLIGMALMQTGFGAYMGEAYTPTWRGVFGGKDIIDGWCFKPGTVVVSKAARTLAGNTKTPDGVPILDFLLDLHLRADTDHLLSLMTDLERAVFHNVLVTSRRHTGMDTDPRPGGQIDGTKTFGGRPLVSCWGRRHRDEDVRFVIETSPNRDRTTISTLDEWAAAA